MFGNLYGQLMDQVNAVQQPMPKPNQIPTKPGYTQPVIGANPMATIAGNIQQQPQGYTQPVQPFATNGFMSGFFQQPQQQMVNQPQHGWFGGLLNQNPQQQNPMQGHPWFNMGQMGHLFNRYRGF